MSWSRLSGDFRERFSLLVFWVQDLVWDWQQAASGVLVAVGRQFISKVMEELLRKLHPGTLPHCAVLHTLASLSVANGRWRTACPRRSTGHWKAWWRPLTVSSLTAFGVVPFLPSVLSSLLPVLGMAKQDTVRMAFCSGKRRPRHLLSQVPLCRGAVPGHACFRGDRWAL